MTAQLMDYRCDGPCVRPMLGKPGRVEHYHSQLGRPCTRKFCGDLCHEAWRAEQRKLDHWKFCLMQDEMNDGECDTCARNEREVSRLTRLAKAQDQEVTACSTP